MLKVKDQSSKVIVQKVEWSNDKVQGSMASLARPRKNIGHRIRICSILTIMNYLGKIMEYIMRSVFTKINMMSTTSTDHIKY